MRFLQLRLFSLVLLAATTAGVAPVAHAETGRINESTMTMVIDRLQNVLSDLHNRAVKARVLARVGDLLSDRAQLRAFNAVKNNCKTCHGARIDRFNAIHDYLEALALSQTTKKALTPDRAAQILTQTAYLYSLVGEHAKAKALYTQIIERRGVASSAELIGEAYAGRGELFFDAGDFIKAEHDYENALRYPIQNANFVQYHLAWCEFDLGDTNQAKNRLIAVLRAPINPHDPVSFRHDMARDLVTFVAREPITLASINELMSVTPKGDRAANLFYLGQEAAHFGNHAGSLLVWNVYARTVKVSDAHSLAMQMSTAQELWDEGRTADSLRVYQIFLKNFASQNCSKLDNCDTLKARSREYVVEWLKRDRLHPNPRLLTALQSYTQTFANDAEMIEWTGHIARHLKQYLVATHEYHLAADAAALKIANSKIDPKKKPELHKILQDSLLGEIECAEATNNTAIRSTAYQHYLQLLPNGPQQLEVRYQIAYLEYKAGHDARAAQAFYAIANSPTKYFADRKWQKLAAHLSIRANVNAAVMQNKNGQENQALSRLKSIPLVGATPDERVRVFRNEIVLAKKLNDVATVAVASYGLDQTPKISRETRRFALENELWADEMKMDFHSAFFAALNLNRMGFRSSSDLLRLALLAELSGHPSWPYYAQYLRQERSIVQANLIREKLVHESRDPWHTLAYYRNELRRTPEIYGATVLECFARDPVVRFLPYYLRDWSIRRSSQYEALFRYYTLAQNRDLDWRLSRDGHRVTPYRMQLIRRASWLANVAVQHHDFILEIVNLNRVERAYQNLASDLKRTPTPRYLNWYHKRLYRRLLNYKIAAYDRDAQSIQRQLQSLWANGAGLNSLTKLAQSDLGVRRRLVIRDLYTILPFAPSSQKSKIVQAVADAEINPNWDEIARAREAVRKNPFDLSRIVKLKQLESRSGNTSMVVFLDARLAQNKTFGANFGGVIE